MKAKGIKLWAYLMRLGNACGCHQIPERSFFLNQWQFPICARCTGVLIGQLLGVTLALLGIAFNITVDIAFLSIMFIDWAIQYSKLKKSTNMRRLITGTLGGIAQIDLTIKLILHFIKIFI